MAQIISMLTFTNIAGVLILLFLLYLVCRVVFAAYYNSRRDYERSFLEGAPDQVQDGENHGKR